MRASPKKHYRPEYVYPWRAALADLQQVQGWQDLSDFDLLLHLDDFSGLRWEPFDPDPALEVREGGAFAYFGLHQGLVNKGHQAGQGTPPGCAPGCGTRGRL